MDNRHADIGLALYPKRTMNEYLTGKSSEKVALYAKAGVPLLHVCGSLDPALDEHTRVLEKRYRELGASVTVIIKEGEGHYPLAPKDPKRVVDFITERTR